MPNEALEKRFELSSIFESSMKRQIEITTVVYSFSKQAVKKIEVIELDEVKKEKMVTLVYGLMVIKSFADIWWSYCIL